MLSDEDIAIIDSCIIWSSSVGNFGNEIVVITNVEGFIEDLKSRGYDIVKRSDDNAKD
ncbi:MAG: hypothetical protein [Caudoviricetes sp.]|nr:MAG: hypothetical protein [Caudoviricetes sp.]